MKSIIIKRLQFSQEAKNLLYSQLEASTFSSDTGEGIRILSKNHDCIICHHLSEKMYSQETYNIETAEFDKIQFKKIDCVPIFIDFTFGTIDIIGNKQQATRIIEYFGKITKYKVAIDDIHVDLLKLLNSCSNSNVVFSISKVKISEYSFFDNIIGDCVLNLFDYHKPLDVIRKYKDQIVSVSISIITDDNYSMTFYKSGSISIYKDIDNIDINFLRLLKQGI